MLAGVPLAAAAQTRPAPAASPATPAAQPPAATTAPAPQAAHTITSLRVEGTQRIEPETALSYTKLRQGQHYTNESLDQAIKDLYASDLFADVTIDGAATGNIVIRVRENPIINRVIFEGNKRPRKTRSVRRSGSSRDRSSPARQCAPTSRGSSSCTGARAVLPRPCSPRWSASTRTAST